MTGGSKNKPNDTNGRPRERGDGGGGRGRNNNDNNNESLQHQPLASVPPPPPQVAGGSNSWYAGVTGGDANGGGLPDSIVVDARRARERDLMELVDGMSLQSFLCPSVCSTPSAAAPRQQPQGQRRQTKPQKHHQDEAGGSAMRRQGQQHGRGIQVDDQAPPSPSFSANGNTTATTAVTDTPGWEPEEEEDAGEEVAGAASAGAAGNNGYESGGAISSGLSDNNNKIKKNGTGNNKIATTKNNNKTPKASGSSRLMTQAASLMTPLTPTLGGDGNNNDDLQDENEEEGPSIIRGSTMVTPQADDGPEDKRSPLFADGAAVPTSLCIIPQQDSCTCGTCTMCLTMGSGDKAKNNESKEDRVSHNKDKNKNNNATVEDLVAGRNNNSPPLMGLRDESRGIVSTVTIQVDERRDTTTRTTTEDVEKEDTFGTLGNNNNNNATTVEDLVAKKPSSTTVCNQRGQGLHRLQHHRQASIVARFRSGLTFRDRCACVAITILALWYILDENKTSIDLAVAPAAMGIILLCTKMTDATHVGEKCWLIISMAVVGMSAAFVITVSDHPCGLCAWHLPSFVREHLLAERPGAINRVANFYHLLLEDNPLPKACRPCWDKLLGIGLIDLIPTPSALEGGVVSSSSYDDLRKQMIIRQEEEPQETDEKLDGTHLIADEAISVELLRDLDDWYKGISSKLVSEGFGRKVLYALLSDPNSDIGSQMLESVLHEELCSPSLRIGGPKPSEYVLRLRNQPRFTGEEGWTRGHRGGGDDDVIVGDEHEDYINDNSTTLLKESTYCHEVAALEGHVNVSDLKAIMRGDHMNRLGASCCFMVRFSTVVITEDLTVEVKKISPAQTLPPMNQSSLTGDDVNLLYPGLFVPRRDEDTDPDGSNSDATTSAIALYTRLPMQDAKSVFFEKRSQYLAFFRFEMEHKVQDEYYFPKWLSELSADELYEEPTVVTPVGGNTSAAAAMSPIPTKRSVLDVAGDLVSTQFRHFSDRLRLTDPLSDQTLGDRAVFGTGGKRLARIKLPSDVDYNYLIPHGPQDFETDEHRRLFGSFPKPSEQDLMTMGKSFWGKDVPLEDFRYLVVEVDYTESIDWEHREPFQEQGAILYLEASSRRPMGIWIATQKELVLPTAGRRWKFAKFYYRSTEIVVLALRHVAEYHMGWAGIVCNAIRQTLPDDHGLRLFIKPYCHGTATVNWNAYQMLIRPHSILHRASGLTEKGRGVTWASIQKHFNMSSTLPDILAAKNLKDMPNLTEVMPIYTQGLKLWEAHRSFVEGFLELMYPSDQPLLNDASVYRLWNHINTMGRNMDPCVCGMEAKYFFEEGHWPAFEESRSCSQLMDFAKFSHKEEKMSRRRVAWCERDSVSRTRDLYSMLQEECRQSSKCPEVSYDFLHMSPNMNLPNISRERLINLLTMFIFEVTAGHALAGDNLPYMTDPAYGGVRVPVKDSEGELPLMVDTGTYIFGNSIALLTTIRALPLLSDWSDLLAFWAEGRALLPSKERNALKRDVVNLHLKYKSQLVVLANKFLQESLDAPANHRSFFFNPATQASSISV